MSNRGVAKRFFENGGKNTHSLNMFSEGNKLYSYGYHYLMAYKLPEVKIVFVNDNGYSNTTAKHTSHTVCEAYRAGYTVVKTTNIRKIAEDLERNNGLLSHELLTELKVEINGRYAEAEQKEKRAKKDHMREYWQNVQTQERLQWEAIENNIQAYDHTNVLSV